MQIQTCTRQIQDLELDTDLNKTDTRSGTRYRLVQDRYKIWNQIQTCTRQIQDLELDTDLYKTDTRSGTRYRLAQDRYKIWNQIQTCTRQIQDLDNSKETSFYFYSKVH